VLSDDAMVHESRALREAIGRFRNYRDWQRHADGPSLTQRVARLLRGVRRLESARPHTGDDATGAVRVAHWNILHGIGYEQILHALTHEAPLANVDFLSLNEVDLGLARSGNRDVAFDLARALGMHAVWAPLFLELEGGHLTVRSVQRQEQRESLFGLALLSRYPLGTARRVELETNPEHLFDAERKVGGFIALVVEVLAPRPFTFVVTHLDVHGAPATRQRQIRAALQEVPRGAAIVCGDFNTTTFPRGSWLRTATTLAILALSRRSALEHRLHWPDHPEQRPREPLFVELARQGFDHAPFNDRQTTLDLRLRDTHEYHVLPGIVRSLASGLFRHVERRTGHRLDWIAARDFAADAQRPPYTLPTWMRGADPASDHAPIGCGLRLP
jgi:endonuclease/exonuclease/phosphatase family metal-dependent hydrolase